MNDLYGAFAGSYIQKADPRKLFSGEPDIESSATPQSTSGSFTQSLTSSIGSVKGKLFGQAPPPQPEPPSIVPAFILSKMSDNTDYTKAIISFALAAVFLLLAVVSLPTIIFSPQRFTMLFTLTVVCLVAGLAFLNGPLTYIKKVTGDRKNLVASGVLFGSMIFSLYFSIVAGSYLMSLLFCFVELNAVLLFFCNTFPMA